MTREPLSSDLEVCVWTRLPDDAYFREIRRIRFLVGCNGETARGAYAIYPDWCPSCRKSVIVKQLEVA